MASATKKTPAEVVFGRRSLAPAEAEDIPDSEFQYHDLADSEFTEEDLDALSNLNHDLESPEGETMRIIERLDSGSNDRDAGDVFVPQANNNNESDALEKENSQQGRYKCDVLRSRSAGANGLPRIENELIQPVPLSPGVPPKSCKQITNSGLTPLEEVTLTCNDHVFGWGTVKNNQEWLHGKRWKDMVQDWSRFVVVIFKKAARPHEEEKYPFEKIYNEIVGEHGEHCGELMKNAGATAQILWSRAACRSASYTCKCIRGPEDDKTDSSASSTQEKEEKGSASNVEVSKNLGSTTAGNPRKRIRSNSSYGHRHSRNPSTGFSADIQEISSNSLRSEERITEYQRESILREAIDTQKTYNKKRKKKSGGEGGYL